MRAQLPPEVADPASRDPASRGVELRVEGVNASYGDYRALNDINIAIRPGEFFALLGPSGCGKTTLLRLIAGFNQADSGRIVVGGADISQLPPWKRDVGMVFQSYALWPHMSVARNVAFGLEERRVPRAEISRRVAAALDLVGLSSQGDKRPSQLSGGQQQRVALARTIAIEPKVLLLDEPLSNLDAKLRLQVRRELRDLQQRLGLTTILVTHDQEEANTICDRVAVMSTGQVQQIGSPTDLYERPANLFVAGFIGTANIIEGAVTGTGNTRVFDSGTGLRVPVPADAEVPAGARMVLRPQDVNIAAAGTTAAVLPRVAGAVTYREFLGSSVRYNIAVGATELWIDAPFRAGDELYEIGHRVDLAISTQAVRWLAA